MELETGQLVMATEVLEGAFGRVVLGSTGLIVGKVHTGESINRIAGTMFYRVTWLANTVSGDVYVMRSSIDPIGETQSAV